MNKKFDFKSIFSYFKRIPKIAYIIALAIIVVVVATVLIIKINDAKLKEKYEPYSEKMKTFGFDKLYDNKSTALKENVTKSEAIKLIIGAIYNTHDISGFAYKVENKYPNEVWVVFATKQGIIPEDAITEKNQSEKISYVDAITYLVKARSVILKEYSKDNPNASFRDILSYNNEQRISINDAVANGLIQNSTSKLKANKKIIKGQLNELISNFVVKYNTITVDRAKININPEKEPSNADIYPYILVDVDKAVYETPLKITVGQEDTLSPKQAYIERKEYFGQFKEFAEKYYNYILNIDYSTINEKDFKDYLDQYTIYKLEASEVKNYVDYVKANKIKITGKATAQLPIVYYSGTDYYIRIKLEFKVESGETKDRILFKDLTLRSAEYKADNSILIDANMSAAINSNSLFVDSKSIQGMIVK